MDEDQTRIAPGFVEGDTERQVEGLLVPSPVVGVFSVGDTHYGDTYAPGGVTADKAMTQKSDRPHSPVQTRGDIGPSCASIPNMPVTLGKRSTSKGFRRSLLVFLGTGLGLTFAVIVSSGRDKPPSSVLSGAASQTESVPSATVAQTESVPSATVSQTESVPSATASQTESAGASAPSNRVGTSADSENPPSSLSATTMTEMSPADREIERDAAHFATTGQCEEALIRYRTLEERAAVQGQPKGFWSVFSRITKERCSEVMEP